MKTILPLLENDLFERIHDANEGVVLELLTVVRNLLLALADSSPADFDSQWIKSEWSWQRRQLDENFQRTLLGIYAPIRTVCLKLLASPLKSDSAQIKTNAKISSIAVVRHYYATCCFSITNAASDPSERASFESRRSRFV